MSQQSKRNFSLHRGFVRLLAEQRDPILKVLFSGRDNELENCVAFFFVRNQAQVSSVVFFFILWNEC